MDLFYLLSRHISVLFSIFDFSLGIVHELQKFTLIWVSSSSKYKNISLQGNQKLIPRKEIFSPEKINVFTHSTRDNGYLQCPPQFLPHPLPTVSPQHPQPQLFPHPVWDDCVVVVSPTYKVTQLFPLFFIGLHNLLFSIIVFLLSWKIKLNF